MSEVPLQVLEITCSSLRRWKMRSNLTPKKSQAVENSGSDRSHSCLCTRERFFDGLAASRLTNCGYLSDQGT